MPRGVPKSTKYNQTNSVKHISSNTWETYSPEGVHACTPLNPMMKYDFLQRRFAFNRDALRFLKSTRVRFTANRALCTFRVVPVYILDIHAVALDGGSIDGREALDLMQWMRMDTNNRTLNGAIALLPCASGVLEANYAALVTRRAAAIAEEVGNTEPEAEPAYATSAG